ncbi:MAG: hypothetical protein V3R33_01540 [Anaerolineales bacterium]
MTYSPSKLLIFVLVLIAMLITACASSPVEEAPTVAPLPSLTVTPTTATPAGTYTPTTLEILQARVPDFEITFNDQGCTVFGPKEITRGEYLVVLHNQTELPANLWMYNYFGEGSFEDHLHWREENCGGQGTHCEDEDGGEIMYSLVTWMGPKLQAHDGINTYYKVYDVKQAREHSFWVSMDMWWGWLCAPIQVNQ